MDTMETLKIIAAAHKKANKIILSCETSDQMKAATNYVKYLKRLCASLVCKDTAQVDYLKTVEESVDSTLRIKRKSFREI